MTVVEDYQARTEELAATTAASVLTLYAALQAGGLTPAAAIEVMAAVVNTANAAATTLADVFTAAQVEVATGEPTPPTGVAPRDDGDRLTKAVTTILDDLPADPSTVTNVTVDDPEQADNAEPDPSATAAMRLERLARAEPLEAGHVAVEVVIARIPRPIGWVRELDSDPCPRCERWAEDGRVFDKDAHFKRHLGCACTQRIVMSDSETRSSTTETTTQEKAS